MVEFSDAHWRTLRDSSEKPHPAARACLRAMESWPRWRSIALS